ncbi:MAG: hypothetical protein ABR497_06755 [Kiritimatiellia bacterium]|nr:hypothetical protein [Lentisphaerota bacterium]
MLKIRQTLKKNAVDPEIFGDAAAKHTDWKPLKRGGANFRTHRLVTTHPLRMEFKLTIAGRIFCLIFLVIGTGFLLGFTVAGITGAISGGSELWIPLLIGLAFTGVSIGMLYWFGTPVVFDKRSGFFWRSRTPPHQTVRRMDHAGSCRLDDIHALQLLSKYCRGNKTSYYSYELNLVMRDGSRRNVVDHGNQRRLREDARLLAEFLEKPLWDAS